MTLIHLIIVIALFFTNFLLASENMGDMLKKVNDTREKLYEVTFLFKRDILFYATINIKELPEYVDNTNNKKLNCISRVANSYLQDLYKRMNMNATQSLIYHSNKPNDLLNFLSAKNEKEEDYIDKGISSIDLSFYVNFYTLIFTGYKNKDIKLIIDAIQQLVRENERVTIDAFRDRLFMLFTGRKKITKDSIGLAYTITMHLHRFAMYSPSTPGKTPQSILTDLTRLLNGQELSIRDLLIINEELVILDLLYIGNLSSLKAKYLLLINPEKHAELKIISSKFSSILDISK